MSSKILIADDDPEVLELVKFIFENENYEVTTATDGEEALRKIKEDLPDILILDIDMPKISGYEICEKIRQEPQFCLTPIVMLTALTHSKDRITGMKLGADEYMTKPFEPLELLTRVENLLKRIKDFSGTNPLTALPGRFVVENEIKERLSKNEKFGVLYIDIDNFKPYNEKYGFEKGDEIIRTTSLILRSTVAQFGTSKDLLVHLGSEDFIIITSVDTTEKLAYKIIETFDEVISRFYDETTKEKSCIWAQDYTGKIKKYPLMHISIGITNIDEKTKYQHFSQVVEKARQMLLVAKAQERSSFAVG